MLQHLLVPLDGSELAEEALQYVRHLAGEGSRVTLITAVDATESSVYGPREFPLVRSTVHDYQSALEQLIPQAKSYLEHVAEHLRQSGIEVHIEAELGEPASIIVDAAKQLNVDAIVMSTHGRSGLGRWLFGSVTTKVLQVASCPVFVIPGSHTIQARRERRTAVAN